MTRLLRLSLALTLSLGAACTRGEISPRAHIVTNGTITPNALPFRFQPFNEPVLDELAAREHIRELVSSDRRQFEQILRVKDWVAAQWPHGTPDPYPPWNALMILDWIRSGKTGGFCGQYSQVLLQSLATLGITARYVEIGSVENPYAHYVTEVWSNDFNKWVMMDADYNVHFERAGTPLSVMQVHDALLDDTLADVRPVLGRVREGHSAPASWPKQTAEFYYYVRYHLKADHLTKPGEPPFDRLYDMIEFDDRRTVRWELSRVKSPYEKTRLTKVRTNDRAAAYAKLNQIQIELVPAAPGEIALKLQDNVLQLDRYEYRAIDASGAAEPWQPLRESTLKWPMPTAGGSLEVRGVNTRGVAGPISTVTIAPMASNAAAAR